MLNNKISVMILAAGYGKRLMPLTKKIPKSLIKIAGKPLLMHIIDNLLKLNCKEIVINTHYKHLMIKELIKNNYAKENIIISHEKNLLDTGGGVKNALHLFSYDKVLILNSDIFWNSHNFIDIKKFIMNFNSDQKCKLLLIPKEKAHGIYNDKGDFIIEDGLIKKFTENTKIYYYSGAQIISLKVLKEFQQKCFSFNKVWDELIKKKLIFGDVMESEWYHIGDINGLKEVENIIT